MRFMLAALAVASVMPTSSILRRYAGHRDDLTIQTLKVEGTAAIAPAAARELAQGMGLSWTAGELTLNATLAVKYPGRCRLELTSVESNTSLSVTSSNGKRRNEGPEFVAAQVAVEELCALFVLKSGGEGETRAAIERHLAALKVDTKQVAHARFLGQLTFAIGSRAENAAQYWVYRDRTPPDRFLPARVRFSDERGSWDVRFADYTSASVSDWLPRMVEVYKGQELQFRLTALHGDPRADIDASKF